VVFGAVFLMPAITSLVASVFVDDIAEHVEREHYPAERAGAALPVGLAMREGIKTALLTLLVYLIALPFVFVAGAGFIAFFIATAWLLRREYFANSRRCGFARLRKPGPEYPVFLFMG
jgi:CysZ protein